MSASGQHQHKSYMASPQLEIKHNQVFIHEPGSQRQLSFFL
ncbi:hypothetical protein M976_00277 [Buttiauxella ferragutiae ATCC 51602]|uniref:Uncharacterized protein n=1 Tax=Buttiauxella ferragutiae ATCC 51602 TaxID=1354252 RepID=A0ABX2WEI0_9ENTR|nr:hypothetical protein M976_00277 [Buttiauxella ferragutiae ATCC 51602]